MGNQITLAYNYVPGEEPGDLYGGELAVNAYNKKIWIGNGTSANTGKTLIFDAAAYAPASANASESYVDSEIYDLAQWDGEIASSTIPSYLASYGYLGGSDYPLKQADLDSSYTSTSSTTPANSAAVKSAYDRVWATTGHTHSVTAGQFSQQNFTTTLKNKLDAIEDSADVNTIIALEGFGGIVIGGGTTKYISHATGSPYNHIPSGGSSGQFLGYSATGTAGWVANPNTTYTAGTGLSLSGTQFNLATSGVSAGVYGSATTVPRITIDSYGRITSATNYSISAGTLLWNGLENISNLTALPS